MDSDPKRLESAQQLAAVVKQAKEQVISATPQKRAADTIEKAAAYLPPGATADQLNHVANHIQCFARNAADLLIRGDIHGLDSAISELWHGVRDADRLAPPKPSQPPRKIVPPAARLIAVGSLPAVIAGIRARARS